jgi:uncharacterized protein (TIGR02302 family)
MTEPAPHLRRLASRRALARLTILFERVWPALWPPLGVAGVFLCLALLDIPQALPPAVHAGLLVCTVVAIVALAFREFRAVRAPDDAQADARLERASGLPNRPLAVLTDQPAEPDAVGLALWKRHQDRAIGFIRHLRVGRPSPGLARRDRRALRCGLGIALFATLVIAGDDAPGRLAAAMEPTLPRAVQPPATELQAWITPPPYTRLAPLFLKPDTGAVSVPAGSHLTVNITGGSGQPNLVLNGQAELFRALDQSSFQSDRTLNQGGRLTVRRSGSDLAAWDLTVVADQPPIAAWAERPGRSRSSQQTRLPWKTSDDYGVTTLQAELRLEARPDAPPLIVSIPLPGGSTKAAAGIGQHDLTAHPWAGLPVIARLIAKDAAGQTGASDDAAFDLPERPFQNPIARALIAIRKSLSLHPDDKGDALEGLDTLMQEPDAFAGDLGAWVNLSAIYYILVRDKSGSAIEPAQDRLWRLALHMEEGQTEQTARALEDARQAARDAMDKATQDPNAENRHALEDRLKELQQAIDRHMQALMEEARRNGELPPADPEGNQLSNKDLDRMADQARDAARQGRMNEAQQKMAELERMLDQLRNARAQQGQNKQGNARRQRGQQQMGAVQDMIGREGGVLDHSDSRVEQTMRPPGGPAPTSPADSDAEREADRRVQQALRRALGELMQQFGDLTGEVPKSLGDADQAMREAGKQLGEGHDKAAGDSQRAAIEALQKGAREMGQAMAKQFGRGQNGEDGEPEDGSGDSFGAMMPGERGDRYSNGGPLPGSPERANPGGRDPLGRRLGQGTSPADESNQSVVPAERERQRTQAIQEELRRRGGERERPRQELDYIDRLLKQF